MYPNYDPNARNDGLIETLTKERKKMSAEEASAFDAGCAARLEGTGRNPNPYRHLIHGPGIVQATAYWQGWDLEEQKSRPVAA